MAACLVCLIQMLDVCCAFFLKNRTVRSSDAIVCVGRSTVTYMGSFPRKGT